MARRLPTPKQVVWPVVDAHLERNWAQLGHAAPLVWWGGGVSWWMRNRSNTVRGTTCAAPSAKHMFTIRTRR